MDAPRVTDTSEVDSDGMTAKGFGGVLKSSYHMVVTVTTELRVWMGNDDDGSGWILLCADNIGLDCDSVKGF
jgi:hypothetical protein